MSASTTNRRCVPALLIAATAVLAGCSGGATAPEPEAFAFGTPAEAAQADETIQIAAGAPFTYDPDEVTVEAGETVTFEVTNNDAVDHDFVIGDQDAQDEHEEEMRAMDDMEGEMDHDEPNAMTVPAGETGSISWTFADAGTVQYGCHEPGHYDAGMFGVVSVEG